MRWPSQQDRRQGQVRELLTLACADLSRVCADLLQAHVAMATEQASKPWVSRAFAQAARSLMGELVFGRRLRPALRTLGPRTHIVHGQKDRLVSVEASRAAVASNPRIQLTELPDMGHVPQIEAPGAFTELVSRWLDRTAPAAAQ